MKTKKTLRKIILMALLVVTTMSYAQVGIGTTNPDASAALEIKSTTKGLLPPRMTLAQIQAIANPAEGLMIYCTDCSPKGLYISDGTFFANAAGTSSAVSSVTGAGGAVWMDRNLGASQVATSSTDAASYGDLYQWGRNMDGHQLRTSSTTSGPVSSGSEGANFVLSTADWLSVQEDTRWNGATKGAHDPCPTGFRVPTITELDTERLAWASNDAAGAFSSPLKLPLAGTRVGNTGALGGVGGFGGLWSSTASGSGANRMYFDASGLNTLANARAHGFSVRCIKE